MKSEEPLILIWLFFFGRNAAKQPLTVGSYGEPAHKNLFSEFKICLSFQVLIHHVK